MSEKKYYPLNLQQLLWATLFASTAFFSPLSGCAKDVKALTSSTSKENTIEILSLFANVFDKIHREYVTEVNDQEVIESAINGMLTSLDPHSMYLNEKEYEELREQNKGEFGGLGLELTMDNGLVKVIAPIGGSPAELAGVKAGDYIFSIEDDPVFGMSLSEAAEKLRGDPGTKVRITVLREGQSEPFNFTITRKILEGRPARSKLFHDVGYIRIESFIENTNKSVETEYQKLRKEAKNPLKGLVLDLRNNPGGLLVQAVEVSDLFLDSGEIVSTRGRETKDNLRFMASKGDILHGIPVVVLINNGSASASEIVAGALQDHKRGIIMGTKSFGKGSVQTILPIPGHGAIKLTTARYYTPSGHSIQAEGITPDIAVEAAKIDYPDNTNTRRINEASLHRHLLQEKNLNGDATDAALKKVEKGVKNEDAVYASDFQLARAFDLLRGLSLIEEALPQKGN